MDENAFELDEVDRAILHLLQKDARDNTTTAIGEQVGVSATTVSNRITRLEEEGIIKGYYPDIHYEKAGLHLHLLYVCEAPAERQSELARQARDVSGVVNVQEVLTGSNDLLVEAVCLRTHEITSITEAIEDLEVVVKNTEILGKRYLKPFDRFGADALNAE